MTNSSSISSTHPAQHTELWQSLKSAIANSSGFQSWYSEQSSSLVTATSTENMVRLYLRETLETLAY
ncbi:hypothetical protein S7335_2149 [Synechococcus sp. PCC 7335]|uniref:hypothetical protein n=1 Tax=Synechococcus sp. (strain ATCC 29403 / PCC 7335) TaxID=91464 RepID=UPI00017EC3C1|nr:hypothetical protein [Synechococcus sp. PCC 7335]EDX84452.1 hypothetical protein S7335_2149 [Synechococcus sp. PCC 7335]